MTVNLPTDPLTPYLTVVALDPSTDSTGLAVVTFDAAGRGTIRHLAAITATAKHRDPHTETVARVRQIRAALAEQLRAHCDGLAIDAVAHEVPPPPQGRIGGGWQAYAAISGAAMAYLTLSRFAGLPVVPVYVSSCKAVNGTGRLSRAMNAGDRARAAKRRELKAAVVAWANQTFGLTLSPDQDAEADALSVAVAAWRIMERDRKEAAAKAAQRSLFPAGSGRTSKSRKAQVTSK